MELPVFPCKPICGGTVYEIVYPHTIGVPADLFTEKFFKVVKFTTDRTGISKVAVGAYVWSPELQNKSIYAKYVGGLWHPYSINGDW